MGKGLKVITLRLVRTFPEAEVLRRYSGRGLGGDANCADVPMSGPVRAGVAGDHPCHWTSLLSAKHLPVSPRSVHELQSATSGRGSVGTWANSAAGFVDLIPSRGVPAPHGFDSSVKHLQRSLVPVGLRCDDATDPCAGTGLVWSLGPHAAALRDVLCVVLV